MKEEKVNDHLDLNHLCSSSRFWFVMLSVRVQAALLITHIHHFQQLRVLHILHKHTHIYFYIEERSSLRIVV